MQSPENESRKEGEYLPSRKTFEVKPSEPNLGRQTGFDVTNDSVQRTTEKQPKNPGRRPVPEAFREYGIRQLKDGFSLYLSGDDLAYLKSTYRPGQARWLMCRINAIESLNKKELK